MSKIFEALQRAAHQPPAEGTSSASTGATAASTNGQNASPPLRHTVPPVEPATLAPAPAAAQFLPGAKPVTLQDRTSSAAEEYNVLRTRLLTIAQQQELKVVLATSPCAGDGKTITVMNLALSFCLKPGTRVLLIDADLRKPAASGWTSLSAEAGLGDYLLGEAPLADIIRPAFLPGFHLICSGRRVDAPAELFHSPHLPALLEVARREFDWIFMDGPPAFPMADCDLLAAHADGILLVVRPLHTPRELLERTMQSLQDKPVLGAVLNDTVSVPQKYYYNYAYGYGRPPANGNANKNGTRQAPVPSAGEGEPRKAGESS